MGPEIARRIAHAACGWLVPGAGHFLRGERVRGILFAATLIGCYCAGELMSEFRAVSKREHDIAYFAQIGAGGPTVAFDWYEDRYMRPLGDPAPPVPVPPLLDCGIMYTCVAGLLNFVLIVDLLLPLRARKPEDDA